MTQDVLAERDPGYPYGDFDAKHWAEEFDRIFPDSRPDTDTMLGWFANAIMTGYDKAANAALVRTPETLDVAGLRREIEALPGEHECWDGDNFVERHTDLLDRAAVLAIVDRLAATPPPEPAIDVGRLARAIAEGDSIDEPAWFEYGKTTIRKMAAMFAAEYDRLGSEPRITPDELQDDLRDLERGSE